MAAITTADLFSHETVKSLVVEPVFQNSVALNSGLRRIDTSATTLYLPVVSGGNADWYGEVQEIGDAGVNADEIPVTPKKVAALQVVSNESADDAGAAAVIGDALVGALSRAVDESFFAGAGPTGPAGLPGITGVTPVTGDPTTDLDAYVDGIAAVELGGGRAGGIYVSPATWQSLAKVKSDATSSVPLLSPQVTQAATRSLFGVPVHVSAYVAASTAWILDTSRVFVVQRTPASVETDDSAYFTSDALAIRAIMRLEFAAPVPAVVAKVAPAGP